MCSTCLDIWSVKVVMPNLNYDVPQDFEGNETMSELMSESMSELERTRMQIILHYLDTNKEINSSIAAKLLKVGCYCSVIQNSAFFNHVDEF